LIATSQENTQTRGTIQASQRAQLVVKEVEKEKLRRGGQSGGRQDSDAVVLVAE
jgi:hypothetical protein